VNEQTANKPRGLLKVASYNIHRCMGTDGAHSCQRVAEVIQALDADVVALQEVEFPPAGRGADDQLAGLAVATGLLAVPDPRVPRPGCHYRNALLTRLPVLALRRLELGVGRLPPRSALDVDLDAGGGSVLRVVATHLGLWHRERRRQVARLLDALASPLRHGLVLLGDMNEWLPQSRSLRHLHARLGRAPAVPTYPARRPLFALDRIWSSPGHMLRDLQRYDTPLARLASDHLPVTAHIRLPAPTHPLPRPSTAPALAAEALGP
jgi:phospholipase D1/2